MSEIISVHSFEYLKVCGILQRRSYYQTAHINDGWTVDSFLS